LTRKMVVEMYVHIYRLLQTYAGLRPLSTVLCERRHGMYGLLLFNGVRNAVIVIAVDGIERKVRMVRLLGYR